MQTSRSNTDSFKLAQSLNQNKDLAPLSKPGQYQGVSSKRLIPAAKFNEYHPWPSVSALRWMIFHSKTNGLDDYGVIKRAGRRVLIDEQAFFNWIESQNQPAQASR